MTQSNAIFGFLAVAFIVFITTRGSLPTYMGFLLSAGGNAATGNDYIKNNFPQSASNDSGVTTDQVVDVAKTAAMFLI